MFIKSFSKEYWINKKITPIKQPIGTKLYSVTFKINAKAAINPKPRDISIKYNAFLLLFLTFLILYNEIKIVKNAHENP